MGLHRSLFRSGRCLHSHSAHPRSLHLCRCALDLVSCKNISPIFLVSPFHTSIHMTCTINLVFVSFSLSLTKQTGKGRDRIGATFYFISTNMVQTQGFGDIHFASRSSSLLRTCAKTEWDREKVRKRALEKTWPWLFLDWLPPSPLR